MNNVAIPNTWLLALENQEDKGWRDVQPLSSLPLGQFPLPLNSH